MIDFKELSKLPHEQDSFKVGDILWGPQTGFVVVVNEKHKYYSRECVQIITWEGYAFPVHSWEVVGSMLPARFLLKVDVTLIDYTSLSEFLVSLDSLVKLSKMKKHSHILIEIIKNGKQELHKRGRPE